MARGAGDLVVHALYLHSFSRKLTNRKTSVLSLAESMEVIGELTKYTGSWWFFVFMLLPLPSLLLSLPLSWFRRCC